MKIKGSIVLILLLFTQPLLFGQTPGTLKWEFKTDGEIYSSPAIGNDGTIYVGSYDKTLYAINPDGTKKWEFTTGDLVGSSPTIGHDGTVYVGSDDYTFYAINPNGTKRWEFLTGSWVFSSPAMGHDGTLYVGSGDNMLYAINPDGTKKWEFLTDLVISSSPAVGNGGMIYAGSWDDKLYAINPDGTEEWEFVTGDYVYSSPSISSDGTIYVGSDDHKLYAINSHGTKKWEFLTGNWVESPVIGSDGTIYVGSGDYKLYAINPDGTKKWEFLTGGNVSSTPAIGNDGTVYVGSDDHKLYAINPDGTKRWEFLTGDRVASSPAIGHDGTIYVGSDDHKLYAIYSDCEGLASSPWPKFRKNERNSGSSGGLACNTQFDVLLLDIDSTYEVTIDIIHNYDEEVVINDLILTDLNDISITSSFPFSLQSGNQGNVTFQINPDSSTYYRNRYELTYTVNGKNGSFSGEAPVAIFIKDKSETAYVAEKVIDAYNSAKSNDEYISLANNTGVIYRLLGEYDIAESYFQIAIDSSLTLGYGYSGIKMNLGVVNSDLSISATALDQYDMAFNDISAEETSSVLAPQIYYNQAWEHYRSGTFSESKTNALQTINHQRANSFLKAKAYVLLGACLYSEGDSIAAIENFIKAMEIDSNSVIADIAEKNIWMVTSDIDEDISFFSIYPNPNGGSFILRMSDGFNEEKVELKLYNSSGRLVMNKNLYYIRDSNEFYVDAPDLIPGLYHLIVVTEKKIHSGAIIIQK